MTGVMLIHKQTYLIDAASVTQEFAVPVNAELIAIEWDPALPNGISFWYMFEPPLNDDPQDFGATRTWVLTLRNTGQTFSAGLVHLRTLVRDGRAWHLMNAGTTTHIRWAGRVYG